MIDNDAVAALADRVLGPQHKGLSRDAWGKTVRDYLRTEPTLDRMSTPLLTVEQAALDSNVSVMADWARSAGVRLAPHGKTTMAPQVWAQQLDAGAWGSPWPPRGRYSSPDPSASAGSCSQMRSSTPRRWLGWPRSWTKIRRSSSSAGRTACRP